MSLEACPTYLGKSRSERPDPSIQSGDHPQPCGELIHCHQPSQPGHRRIRCRQGIYSFNTPENTARPADLGLTIWITAASAGNSPAGGNSSSSALRRLEASSPG